MELLLAERKLSTWKRKLCLTNIERRIFKPINFGVNSINDKITHVNILFLVIFNVHFSIHISAMPKPKTFSYAAQKYTYV